MNIIKSFYSLIKIISILIITIIIASQCKKEFIQPSSNIILHDKPLRVIRANIRGSWKLCYEKGGICMLCPPTIKSNEYYEFSDNWVVWTANNVKLAFTKIIWKYEKDVYEENTNIMCFYDTRDYPYSYIVDRIINDTLVLKDNSWDAVSYFLARSQ